MREGSGFRRRLVLVFVAVAGLAAALLALGTYLLVRDHRTDAFVANAVESARLGHLIVQREHDPLDLEALVGASARSAGFDTIVTQGERTVLSSNPRLDARDLPPDLAARLAAGDPDDPEPLVIDDVRYLTFGGPAREPGRHVFFLFTQAHLAAEMAALGRVLAALWLLVVVAAALVGNVIAKRTLLPVREAAVGAQRLAEGLLETRLPVRTGDEFGVWATCFNEMAEALEDKIAELGRAHDLERRFTADVAHELRTPLTALLGAVSLLEDELGALPERARRPAELVVNGVRRLRVLVHDLLELYALEQGSSDLVVERFSMDECVRGCVDLYGWAGRLALDLQPVEMESDRRRFERIATNLMANAVEHGMSGVRVRVFEDGPDAVLEVRVSGAGIREDDLPHVFGRFYKADPARRKGGPGLGLAIAAENAGCSADGSRLPAGIRPVRASPCASDAGPWTASRAPRRRRPLAEPIS
ncbi:MAG: histidine kinase dimerization/phospho-acceptor domain-containing protein [Actinomycetota bacterium]